ncbi:MAG: leucine--tRNA ligase [Bacteroidales bacterium]|jgi:leucyl-tRNA synthetase|nr:leucine--tRNA ligase [Bacteroidales bacterium]
MEYNHREIESFWQKYWEENSTYKVSNFSDRPKFYVLDMFPYPSGAGLHVGHPLGYIASDIYSRYKRLKGFNVLHPMGYDAFGLPAEQYAVQTGQHPAVTTENNIARYRTQLKKIGFSYDWSRELRTCDPKYYKWTQWAFIQMYGHFYNNDTQKAEPIENLIKEFEQNGNLKINAAHSEVPMFPAEVWAGMDTLEKDSVIDAYRLAYRAKTMVNWCPKLGTVLANDEVKDGVSERGGYPVIQKPMVQWLLRVSAYAERLLKGLETIDWSDSLKEMQRNWIGKSEGCEMYFAIKNSDIKLKIYTTRPDTVHGVTFMVLAPESEYVDKVTTFEYQDEVQAYIQGASKRTELERMSDTRTVTGQFTGAYAINPFTGDEIPIWISDYVLAGYGTGAIMAVPAHDSRDYAFAKKFSLPIIPLIEGADVSEQSYDAKEGIMMNSGIFNGLNVKQAKETAIQEVEKRGIGNRKVNYRLRDAIFSRQRYWGEPFPVYYKDGRVEVLPLEKLPLELPEIDSYQPTESGEPPLSRAKNWKTAEGYPYETSTMPGFAGSSAYYLRYMDPENDNALVDKKVNEYWQDVDLYIGGTEHAVGHLIYSRFWDKFLYDLGYVCKEEPFKKLVNQGMIQGRSNFVYRIKDTNTFVSLGLKNQYDTTELHVDVNIVKNDILDIEAFKKWRPEYATAEFILEDGNYVCGYAIEKMSKSMFNVVNPDSIVEKYGADTLRLYEMFLGPIQQSKPWDTGGIEGVYKFLKKFWRLFYSDKNDTFSVSDEEPTEQELKALNKTVKKVESDILSLSYNTSVSAFMVCVNELQTLKCNKRKILEPLTIALAPFAPHITEELWKQLGHTETINNASFPEVDEKYTVDATKCYPIAINGKTKFTLDLPADADKNEIEKQVLENERLQKLIEGKTLVKTIVVPGKMVNFVIK